MYLNPAVTAAIIIATLSYVTQAPKKEVGYVVAAVLFVLGILRII